MKYLLPLLLILSLNTGCAVISAVGDIEKYVTELVVGKPKTESKRGAAPYKTKPYEAWDGEANCTLCNQPLFRKPIKEKVRSLLGLGVTAGLVLFVGGIIAGLVCGVKWKVAGPIIGAGAILAVLAILLDAYLNIIIIAVLIGGGLVGLYLLYLNRVKLRAMVNFGDAVIEAGDLDAAAIDAAADAAIGPADSPLRKDIKATVVAARNGGGK